MKVLKISIFVCLIVGTLIPAIVLSQDAEPAAYYSGTIEIFSTGEPAPVPMEVILRHRASVQVYEFVAGDWTLRWDSSYWIEETTTASPDYEHQIRIDDYNDPFPSLPEEGEFHFVHEYGFDCETVIFNQGQWCIIGPHVQAGGPSMDQVRWYVKNRKEDLNDNAVLDLFERPLVEKFCPSLALNEPDGGVAPEPVHIMAPSHASQLWARTYSILGRPVERQISENWDPPVSEFHRWIETGNYSFLDGSPYFYVGAPPDAARGPYFLVFHHEWAEQGNSPSAWRQAYHSEALNNDFEDTFYAHIYYLGTAYVIQYWFFYPFNDFINNHEGDWEHINVVVDSQDPEQARIMYVDYYFHHQVLTAERIGQDYFVQDGTHPIVFVGGSSQNEFGSGHGSHGSFPVNGSWEKVGGGCCELVSTQTDEYVGGTGRFIPYHDVAVEIIPDPDEVDYRTHPEMSWLKANIPWGHIEVTSPGDEIDDWHWLSVLFGDCCFPDDIGNNAPCGPAYNGGWNRTGRIDNWYEWYDTDPPFYPVTKSDWIPPYPSSGDVTGDSWVNILDVTAMVDAILHRIEFSAYQTWAAERNGDGQVNVLDVMSTVADILGLAPDFSSPPPATVQLVPSGNGVFSFELVNEVDVAGVELHLDGCISLDHLERTGRSGSLDTVSRAAEDGIILLLYGAGGSTISSGSGAVLNLKCAAGETPRITEVVISTSEGNRFPLMMLNPPAITVVDPPAGGDDGDGTYTIKWISSDPDGEMCQVSLFYDTDTAFGGASRIVSNTEDDGRYEWDLSNLDPGAYYVYAVINDGQGGEASDYSAGPVRISQEPPQECDIPTLASVQPTAGDAGTKVWLRGREFGSVQGSGKVTFFPGRSASVVSWKDDLILCHVPVGARTGMVTVRNECGVSNGRWFTVLAGGCPYARPWTRNGYAVGNNILIASEDETRADLNTVDYFHFEEPCQERDGRYWVRVEEFEQEHTWLDQVELVSIDHPRGLHSGVTDDGFPFLYKRQRKPVDCVDSTGTDWLHLIDTVGGGDYEGFCDGWLTIDFGHVGNLKNLFVEIVADLRPPPSKEQSIVLQLRGEEEREWKDIALLHPRQNWATHLVDLRPWLEGGSGDIVIRLYWLAQHKVDYVGLVQTVPGPMKQGVCSLESAVHSESGLVMDSLLCADRSYAELLPGQHIELAFQPPRLKKGFERDFILKAVGYYRSEDVELLPKSRGNGADQVPAGYGLSQNNPNPFNSTTKISYQLSAVSGQTTSRTTLKIYNILGEEIRTLVDEVQHEGHYTATWDGRNGSGAEVPSGIYFYCLETDGFWEIKRMVLLR